MVGRQPAVGRLSSIADRPVVLVGLMGAGKTTVGRQLATRWHRRFVDNDAALVARSGRNAAAIAAADGVDVLHRLEADSLLDVLAVGGPPVVAAAASTVLDPRVREALRAGAFVIWLQATAASLAERLAEPGTRPNLGRVLAQAVVEQRHDRDPLYAEAADLIVDTTGRPSEAVAATIATAVEGGAEP